MQWIPAGLSPEVAQQVVAIEGKTLRGSRDTNPSPIHLVWAFASEAGIVLGQRKTDQKSNEITAIPEWLEWLDVRGALVTVEAMGCQKTIAEKIIGPGGDYLLALKGNQSSLPEDVELHFTQPTASSLAKMSTAETLAQGHGRIEIRRCWLSTDIEWLQHRHPQWSNLNSRVAIESERQVGETISPETRYFISSSLITAAKMACWWRLAGARSNALKRPGPDARRSIGQDRQIPALDQRPGRSVPSPRASSDTCGRS